MTNRNVDWITIKTFMQLADAKGTIKFDGKLTKDESEAISVFESKIKDFYNIESFVDNMRKRGYDPEATRKAAEALVTALKEGKDVSYNVDTFEQAMAGEVGTSGITPMGVTAKAAGDVTSDKAGESEQSGGSAAEVAFNKRYSQLANVTTEEMKKAYIHTGNKDHGFLYKITLEDVLKFDYLNEDLANDKEGILTKRIKAQNPKANDNEIKSLVEAEKKERQKRFNSDGTYNLQELADVLPGALGVDYTANQSKNRQVAEMNKAAGRLGSKLFPNGADEFYDANRIQQRKYEKVTTKLTKELIPFLGGKVEGNRHKIAEAFGKGAKEGLPAAVGTGLAPFFIQKNYMDYIVEGSSQLQVVTADGLIQSASQLSNDVVQELHNTLINMATDAERQAYLKEYFGENIIAQFQFSGDEIVSVDVRLLNSLANIATSLGVSIAVAVLKDLIWGEAREFETAVVGLAPFNIVDNPDEVSDVEAFKKAVDKSDKEFPKGTKELLKALADKFTYEDDCGNKRFDYQDMYDCLRAIAGNDSVLNATELVDSVATERGQNIIKSYLEEMEKKKCCPEANKTEESTETENDDTEVENTENVAKVRKTNIPGQLDASSTTQVLTMEYEVQPGDYWYGIVDAFYPGLVGKLGYMGAIRALQKALATDESGAYDKNKYYQITHSNLKGHTNRSKGTILVLPPEIEGIKRKDDAVPSKKTQAELNPNGSGNRRASSGLNKAGVEISKTDLTTSKSGDSVYYTARDGDSTATGKTSEDAVKNLEKKTKKKYSRVENE